MTMPCPNKKITYQEKQEIFSILNKISLFGGLTAGELDFLIPMLTTTTIKKGDYVFYQGDSPNNIFIIQSGEVDIIKYIDNKVDPDNKIAIPLIRFGQGNLFGETELIGIFKYIASAKAVTDIKLLVMPKSALYSLHSKDIKLFSKIILNIARDACRRTASTDEYWVKKMTK